jgi:putative ABC transport system substrate-binding protein
MRAKLLSRRQFLQGSLGLLGLSSIVGCEQLSRERQRSAKVYRIGILTPDSREGAAPFMMEILETLAELGYAEGQNLAIEGRFGATESQLPALAADLVQARVDVIVPGGTPAARAAKAATSTIPVVIISSDPVGAGLVDSLAHPGGNVTGVTNYVPDLTGKRLQLLREVIPTATRIAFLTNPDNPTYAPQEKELGAAAATLGVLLQRLEVRTSAALSPAFTAASAQHADALLVLSDSLVFVPQREPIAQFAVRHGLATMSSTRDEAAAGSLLAYGVNMKALRRVRAVLIDKIFRGARPADLPIEAPTTFDFAINLKTAQALGLTIPPSVLQQATELIQ